MRQSRMPRIRAVQVSNLAAMYPLAILVLSLMYLVAPQTEGPFALLQIIGAYLFLLLLVLIPFAWIRGAILLRTLLIGSALVYAVRFCALPGIGAPLDIPQVLHVSALTWNVYSENPHTDRLYDLLKSRPADIVALQEVRWPALYADPNLSQAYPYQLDHQEDSVPGLALLSVFPILAHGVVPDTVNDTDSSGVIWARIDLGSGRSLLVLDGHPNSPYEHASGCSPIICFDPAVRNHQLAAVRTFVAPLLEKKEQILILGDLNLTDQEPMYRVLVAGLQDAHRQVSVRGGATWRPLQLRNWPYALLRIDYMLSSRDLIPLTLTEDCAPRGSDHCAVHGTFELPNIVL